jgi:hypothetical protein
MPKEFLMTSKEYASNLARGIRVRFTLKAHSKDGQYCVVETRLFAVDLRHSACCDDCDLHIIGIAQDRIPQGLARFCNIVVLSATA